MAEAVAERAEVVVEQVVAEQVELAREVREVGPAARRVQVVRGRLEVRRAGRMPPTFRRLRRI